MVTVCEICEVCRRDIVYPVKFYKFICKQLVLTLIDRLNIHLPCKEWKQLGRVNNTVTLIMTSPAQKTSVFCLDLMVFCSDLLAAGKNEKHVKIRKVFRDIQTTRKCLVSFLTKQ